MFIKIRPEFQRFQIEGQNSNVLKDKAGNSMFERTGMNSNV